MGQVVSREWRGQSECPLHPGWPRAPLEVSWLPPCLYPVALLTRESYLVAQDSTAVPTSLRKSQGPGSALRGAT